MILVGAREANYSSSAPRIRGDDPVDNLAVKTDEKCSPHPRG